MKLILTVKRMMSIFKLENYFHDLLNIFSMSLGNGLALEPEKVSQRIVFCYFILLLGFSNIYGVITAVKMTNDTFVKLDTLEDTHVANLSLTMPVNTFVLLKSRHADDV